VVASETNGVGTGKRCAVNLPLLTSAHTNLMDLLSSIIEIHLFALLRQLQLLLSDLPPYHCLSRD